jgi:hypothetical protein
MQTAVAGKTYGTIAAERRSQMSGIEFVRGLVEGTLPLNTIARTLCYDISEVAEGRVVVTARPTDALLNPAGTVHGGFAATLLDSCMGLAVCRRWRRASARPRSNSRFRWCGRSRRRPA